MYTIHSELIVFDTEIVLNINVYKFLKASKILNADIKCIDEAFQKSIFHKGERLKEY